MACGEKSRTSLMFAKSAIQQSGSGFESTGYNIHVAVVQNRPGIRVRRTNSVSAAWKKRPRVPWNKLTLAKLVRVIGFEFIGERETYDVEVQGPNHNFTANGVVTHNSVNEYSTRYSLAIDAAQMTDPGDWRS